MLCFTSGKSRKPGLCLLALTITEKELDLTVGMLTVNWDGNKVEAEILALDGKSCVVLLHVT